METLDPKDQKYAYFYPGIFFGLGQEKGQTSHGTNNMLLTAEMYRLCSPAFRWSMRECKQRIVDLRLALYFFWLVILFIFNFSYFFILI